MSQEGRELINLKVFQQLIEFYFVARTKQKSAQDSKGNYAKYIFNIYVYRDLYYIYLMRIWAGFTDVSLFFFFFYNKWEI